MTTTTAERTETELGITIACFYEGKPVPWTTIAEAMGLNPDNLDELTSIVRAEERAGTATYRTRLVKIGRGGQLLRGRAALHFVPDWAE